MNTPSTYWLIVIITVGAALVYRIYFFQILWPWFRDLFASPKNNVDLRLMTLAMQHTDRRGEAEAMMTPELALRLLQAAENDQGITCLFVNEGSSVMNLSARGMDGTLLRIEPAGQLRAGQSGYVRLPFMPSSGTPEIRFEIRFEDSRGLRCREDYVYLVEEKVWLCAHDVASSISGVERGDV